MISAAPTMNSTQTWPEETAEDLYENAPCGYLSTLPDGTIIRANQTFLKQTGHSRDALIGTCVQELMTVPGRVFYETHFAPLLRIQGSVKEIACDLLRPARHPVPVLLNAVQLRDEAGQPALIRFAVFDATDRRLYESDLRLARKHAEHFAAIVKTSADAILSIGADGRVLTWNAGAGRLFGYTTPEAIGCKVLELIVLAEDDGQMAAVIAQLEAGHAVRRETVCIRRDGRRIDVAFSLTPHIEPPGEITGVSAIIRDITINKRAEATVRASEEHLSDFFENATIGLHWVGPDGIVLRVNKAELELLGYTRAEYVGHHIAEFHASQATIEDILTRLQCGEVLHDREAQLLCKDGSIRDVLISSSVLRDSDGNFVHTRCFTRDITAHKAAERALRESTARLALGVHVAELALAEVDYTAGTTHLSAEAARLFGLGTAEMVVPRAAVHATFHPEDRAELQHRIAASLDPAGIGWFTMDHRVIVTDGAVRWLRVRKQVFFEGEGADRRPSRATLVALDVTAEKTTAQEMSEAREKAEAASRAKDNFLAALSHELRTPLTPALMAATALREDASLPADTRAQLAMIERNVTLEARLIDDLLDLTRITHGKLTLRTEPCDVHTLLALVHEMVREEAREREVELTLDLTAQRTRLLGDPVRLQQFLWNLIRNAVKFTPPGGLIRIRTSHDTSIDEARIRIEVQDTGIGFDPDAAHRIFDPFDQGAAGHEHRFGGLGLGLAIARAIVEQHRGAIRAESSGPGQGATFTVELPGANAESISPGPASQGARDAQPEVPMRLLVVEDHKATREVLTRLLTRAGHRVVAASSIAGALAAAAGEEFDVVISDLGLPDGNGHHLMASLRDDHGLRGIALSGYGTDEDVRRSLEAGFGAHLVKPVDMNELRRALRQLASDGG